MSKQYTDISTLAGRDEVAIAIGNMILAWTGAESAILYAMCAICGIQPNQALFGYYRIPTFEARVKFLLAMIPEWETKKYDKGAIAKAIEAISGLSGTRNNWVHNVWAAEKTTGELVVFNFRAPDGKGRTKPVKAHDIQHHTETVRQRTRELRALIPDIP